MREHIKDNKMGYRSKGMIWLPKETYEKLPIELIEDLQANWVSYDDYKDVWGFNHWKWYESYSDVKAWTEFVYDYCYENELEVDLIVVGEDNAVIENATGKKFYTEMTIGVL